MCECVCECVCVSVCVSLQPDFSNDPLTSDEAVNRWLRFYDMSSPLTCLSEFVSHDPVSKTPPHIIIIIGWCPHFRVVRHMNECAFISSPVYSLASQTFCLVLEHPSPEKRLAREKSMLNSVV